MIILFVILLALSAVGNVILAYHVMDQKMLLAAYDRKNKELSAPPKPVCVCDHGINYHAEDGKGKCTQESFDLNGVRTKNSFVCKCKRYTGPEPLPEFYHPLELK